MASPKEKITRLPTAAKVPPRPLAKLERCPEHGWVVLAIFSLRPCCLVAALQRIAAGDGDAKSIAQAALLPNDPRVKRAPRVSYRRSPPKGRPGTG
ncbi:MAG: hypothetical protein ABI629_12415 [bacterium]